MEILAIVYGIVAIVVFALALGSHVKIVTALFVAVLWPFSLSILFLVFFVFSKLYNDLN